MRIPLDTSTNRAKAKFTGQNGKVTTLHPALQSSCRKHPRKRHRTRSRARHREPQPP